MSAETLPLSGEIGAGTFDALASRLIGRRVPLHALFEITERCNYRCTHCYLPHRDDDELSTEEAFAALDSLADAGTLFLTISGGEIFLRRDVWEILEHARAKEFVTRYFTNGWFVDDDKADRIAALSPLAVEISLYGPDPASFEEVTQVPGSFERTTGAIRRLVERGVRVVAKTPVMRVNARRLAETHALATALGASFRFDALLSPMDGGEITPLALRATTEDLAEAFAFEKALIGEVPGAFEPKSLESAPCNAGRGAVSISPRGDVYPCVAIKVAAGNLRTRPFAEIWYGQGGILGELRGITVASLKTCSTCEDRGYCPRCAGVARHEEGALDLPNLESCRIASVRRAVHEGRPIPETPVPPFRPHPLRILS